MSSRISKILAGLFIISFLVTACAPKATATTTAPVKKKVIGFSVYDMQYGFFQDMEKGTHEAATAAGYDYVLVMKNPASQRWFPRRLT